MAIETPARIAVLGAGPIGLEAALYARYLGYDVDLYERGRVAEHVRRWGHVRMFSPFGQNRSPLGLAALKAQDPNWQPPADDALLLGHEYAEQYLLPLAKSDLLVDGIHEQTEVVAVGREGFFKSELPGHDDRADGDFRLLLRTTDATGHVSERYATAEAVIDTTGTYSRPNSLGPGGLPAIGEELAAAQIEYGVPDVLGAEHSVYAGRSILLVGDGDSAATTLVALAELAGQTPNTWVTWITRGAADSEATGPISVDAHDPINARTLMARRANQLATDDANHITHLRGTAVEAVTWHADLGRFSVRLLGQPPGELEFDRIIANVGYRGNRQLYRELHVAEDPITGAPQGLHPSGEGAERLLLAEADFYVLGAKSRGRDARFLIADGLQQIQQLFTILGDRAELNLYSTMAKLC